MYSISRKSNLKYPSLLLWLSGPPLIMSAIKCTFPAYKDGNEKQ